MYQHFKARESHYSVLTDPCKHCGRFAATSGYLFISNMLQPFNVIFRPVLLLDSPWMKGSINVNASC